MTSYQSINIAIEEGHYDDNSSPSSPSSSSSSPGMESSLNQTEHSFLIKNNINDNNNNTNNNDDDNENDDNENEPGYTYTGPRRESNNISSNRNNNNSNSFSGFIVISTLFFGFAIGFSVAYYAITQNNNNPVPSESLIFIDRSNYRYNPYPNSNIRNNNNNNKKNDIGTFEKLRPFKKNLFEFLDQQMHQEQELNQEEHHHQHQHEREESSQRLPLLRFPFPSSTTTHIRPLIYLNRPDAYALLIDSIPSGEIATMSQYSSDFFLISSGLDAQINQFYCGVASAVAVLNSLRFLKSTGILNDGVDFPVDPKYAPHEYATQIDIFNNCTKTTVISNTDGGFGVDGIISPPFGLSMPQVAGVLRCHLNASTTSGIGWDVQAQYVDTSHITVGKMRFDLKNALSNPNSRVLVNYDRGKLGQDGGGHWSPIGSYSEKQDAFLILDVAKYKYPPVWAPAERLYDSLATYDLCGVWNFPNGQDELSEEERNVTFPNNFDWTTVMDKLGCEKELRGYIIVTRT